MPEANNLVKNTSSVELPLLFGQRFPYFGVSRLLVGLSGGADSVALLRLLVDYAHTHPGKLTLKAVHCNFSLRGAESDCDEEFCRRLCSKLGVDLETKRFQTRQTADLRGISIEMACRDLRYDYFRQLMADEKWQRVAVAHHQDDNAETLLLNLLRGSGIKGLKGMVADNGTVLRPLLSFSRAQLRQYLMETGQNFRTDSSNADTDYRRNFLRCEILPLLQTRWPAAVKSIARSAEILSREWQILEEANLRYLNSDTIAIEEILGSPEPETAIFYFIRKHNGSATVANEIYHALTTPYPKANSGQLWILGDGHRVSREREHLEILPPDVAPLMEITQEQVKLTPEIYQEIIHNRDQNVAWIPLSAGPITIRRAEKADRLQLAPTISTTVSKLMKDRKLTRKEKESTPIAATQDGKPIWVAGIRRGCGHPVSADTEYLWKLTLLK